MRNKTLLEKEKLLVTTNSSFSHNVFESFFFFRGSFKKKKKKKKNVLCGKGLTLFKTTYFRLFQTERVFRRQFSIR